MMPRVQVFDVNETLLDLAAMDPRFQRIFGDAGARVAWFTQMIQSALVATVTGAYRQFGAHAMAARPGRAAPPPSSPDPARSSTRWSSGPRSSAPTSPSSPTPSSPPTATATGDPDRQRPEGRGRLSRAAEVAQVAGMERRTARSGAARA
jgi:hypothetical protein